MNGIEGVTLGWTPVSPPATNRRGDYSEALSVHTSEVMVAGAVRNGWTIQRVIVVPDTPEARAALNVGTEPTGESRPLDEEREVSRG